MVFLLVVFLVGAYSIAASWAVRDGLGRLWLTACAALLLTFVFGILLGRYYAVPSLSRLLLYWAAIVLPIVLVPTIVFSCAKTTRSTWTKALSTAILGACLGLVLGFVIAVFGLRVW